MNGKTERPLLEGLWDGLEDAELEVIRCAEEAGYYVHVDYEAGRRCVSVHERISADRFDFDNIELMTLTSQLALSLSAETKFCYDGDALLACFGGKGLPEYEEHIEPLDEAGKDKLRTLMTEAEVVSWKQSYDSLTEYGLRVLDGYGWDLVIWFKDGKVLASQGSNAWPESFYHLWSGMCAMLGLAEDWNYPFD